jgi:hypothetical protein
MPSYKEVLTYLFIGHGLDIGRSLDTFFIFSNTWSRRMHTKGRECSQSDPKIAQRTHWNTKPGVSFNGTLHEHDSRGIDRKGFERGCGLQELLQTVDLVRKWPSKMSE